MPEGAQRLLNFARRVMQQFYRRKGLLLASAVAYNALLSLVPLVGLVLVLLSHFIEPEALMEQLDMQLRSVVPAATDELVSAIRSFLEARAVASGVGAGVVIFFSAIAFRTVDDALSSIFDAHRPHKKRHPILSWILPFLYMGMVVAGVALISALLTVVDMMTDRHVMLLGIDLSLVGLYEVLIQIVAFAGLVGLLASFYRVLPEADVQLKHALVGGTVAAFLWEVLRRLLIWYFANVSLVGVIYGSLTTVIVLLLTFEVGALILLIGGQVIAEINRSVEAGIPWYEDPDELEDESWIEDESSTIEPRDAAQ